MRILHVSDFHYHHPWFDWLAAQAADYDAACLTGDLLDMLCLATTDGLRPQSKWVRGWLATWPAKTLLFVCSGNHDWWPKSEHVVDNDREGGWLKKARRPTVLFARLGRTNQRFMRGPRQSSSATHRQKVLRFLPIWVGKSATPKSYRPPGRFHEAV